MSTVSAGRTPDLWLLLLAFIIAVSVKFAVHETEQLTERILEAQITYTPPGPQWVSYDKIDKVKVGVRGKASDMSRLSVFNLEVVAEIPPGAAGPATLVLDEDNVRFNVGGDFEVVSIDPKTLTVQVEPRVTKVLPVKVILSGEPAAGAVAGKPRPRPAQVQVSGPESKVMPLQEITAEVPMEEPELTIGLDELSPSRDEAGDDAASPAAGRAGS